MKGEEKAKFRFPPPNPKGPVNPEATDAGPAPSSGHSLNKDNTQQHIKSMLADAAMLLQQAVPSTSLPGATAVPAVPISPAPKGPGPAAGNVGQADNTVTPGTPVTLAALSAPCSAAANGRVAAVLSSAPYRTWCTHVQNTGQSEI